MKKLLILLGIGIIMILSIIAYLYFNSSNYYVYINGSEVESNCKNIVENGNINIVKKGIYNIKGNTDKYGISINTNENVTLIIEDVNLTNKNNVIDINQEHVTIILKGQNYINSTNGIGINSVGTVEINGEGILEINAKEGIKSKENINIADTNVNIYTTNGDAIDTNKFSITNSKMNINTNGIYILSVSNGRYVLENDKYYKVGKDDVENYKKLYALETSCKAVNAENEINIINAELIINSLDDCLNSKEKINIEQSNLKMTTNDDAIGCDKAIDINKSSINIEQCFEGIEGNRVVLKQNDINIIARDDAINVLDDEKNWEGHITIDESNVKIEAIADGMDIVGECCVYNSDIEIYAYDNGIQTITFFQKGGIVKSFTTNNDTFAMITTSPVVEGELLLVQQQPEFWSSESIKTPYVKIEEKGKFKVVDNNKKRMLEIDNDEFKYYIYINSEFNKEQQYNLIYGKEEKEIQLDVIYN